MRSRCLQNVLLVAAIGVGLEASCGADQPADFERERALQPGSVTYTSFAKAWDTLERCIEVHGGTSVGEAYTDLAMSFLGRGTRTASQRFVGETVDYRVRGAVGYSSLFDAMSFVEEITVGEQVFRGYTVTSRDQVFRVPTGEDLPEREPDLVEAQRTLQMLLPYYWIGRAEAARESLRWMGEHEIDGETLGALSFADDEGGATLMVNLDTGELRRIELLTTHFVQGDASGWIEFDGYEEVNGHRLPAIRRERSVEGRFIREAELEFAAIRAETVLPSNIFFVPQEFRFAAPDWSVTEDVVTPDPPTKPWNTVTPGVHWVDLSEEANTQVLVIEHENGCTVFNSPLTDALAAEVLRAIEANLPEKPVERIVCATFHPRFAGGLRTYLAAGATIVTTPANEQYIRQILTTPTRLVPEAPGVELGEDDLVLVEGEMTFGEGENRFVVYDIGEQSNTTESYLVGWHPETKILLTSDLFAVLDNRQVRGASARTQGLAAWLEESGLEPVQFIPTSPINGHKRIMLPEDLEDSMRAIPGGAPDFGPPVPGN